MEEEKVQEREEEEEEEEEEKEKEEKKEEEEKEEEKEEEEEEEKKPSKASISNVPWRPSLRDRKTPNTRVTPSSGEKHIVSGHVTPFPEARG
ncbi:hypothetical protein ACOMHN_061027 [Nucella lapillus]